MLAKFNRPVRRERVNIQFTITGAAATIAPDAIPVRLLVDAVRVVITVLVV